MLIAYNHFLAYIILKCVNYIKIEGNVLFLKNINGECMNYRVEDVEMIIKRKTGYKIKTRDKNFRIDYNQDAVCIIVNGEERKEIIPNDFPNAIYEVKQ